MCTVSYLPLGAGYLITSNRDETPNRRVTEVVAKSIGTHHVHFPQDPKAGGSWFGISELGVSACLLNGAYDPIDHSIDYPDSRGNALLAVFAYSSVEQYIDEYVFEHTAPFTLIVASHRCLDEVVWDGTKIHHRTLDRTRPYFWSSVTLYDAASRTKRANLFDQWLHNQQHYSQAEILDFHRYGYTDDLENGFVMDRNGKVRTLSISSVKCEVDRTEFVHIDLEDQRRSATIVIAENTRLVENS